MIEIDQPDDEDLKPATPSVGDADSLRDALKARCDAADIPFENFEPSTEIGIASRFALPCGRERRWVHCWISADYERVLSIPFERYTFLHGLDTIANYAEGEIEATIHSLANDMIPSYLYSKIMGLPLGRSTDRNYFPPIVMDCMEDNSNIRLILGRPSPPLTILARSNGRPQLSIKVQTGELTQHDQVVKLLQRTSDSLFFQIDLISGVALSLTRDKGLNPRRRAMKRSKDEVSLVFPTHEYDSAPISLYWYARSATGLPLLQFLAYYQVIEYYFPIYSQAEARRRIKEILKDPAFRGEKDSDIGRLLSAIHVSRSGGVGDERSQLRATLAECIDPNTLREFLISDVERSAFLAAKTKGLAEHKIPIANSTADLRNDVADRIYEIRCKIVHAKADARNGDVELLLPFSKESEQLSYDIELVQYVAQQILISASSPYRR